MWSLPTSNDFASRINPRRFNFSPLMAALVGAIISHDYGVRDSKGGRLTAPLSIMSDGFVVAGSTAHESGAFIGTAEDLDRNIANFLPFLNDEDRERFGKLYAANVNDWRGHGA